MGKSSGCLKIGKVFLVRCFVNALSFVVAFHYSIGLCHHSKYLPQMTIKATENTKKTDSVKELIETIRDIFYEELENELDSQLEEIECKKRANNLQERKKKINEWLTNS